MRHLNQRLTTSLYLLLTVSTIAAPCQASSFVEITVFNGLTQPTVVRFADDGRVFVAEKAGLIKVFDGLSDPSPEILIDLTENTNSFWDRGLLGLALHPDFPTHPYLYVLYTYDAPPGGTAPTWNDVCPAPPAGNIDGCVVEAHLSRFEITEEGAGPEEVLLDGGWCQQFPSHSIGTIEFGPDGALYVGAGDGASFHTADYGQLGGSLPDTPTPLNPCGDPSVPIGGMQTLPNAEGGALRSQDILTTGDPVTFDGSILRLDPETGAALPDNPLVGGSTADDDRIIAHGLRNPFRFFVHPITNEVWIGDVGWHVWEEINRILSPTDAVVENFGWPCYEGASPHPDYDELDLTLCENLYKTPGSVTPPFFSYSHNNPPDPEGCGSGTNAAISGITFYLGGHYPPEFEGALFFADASRGCIWTMSPDEGGLPDPSKISTFVDRAGVPVHLQIGPEGDLFYVDNVAGEVRRVVVDSSEIFSDGFESGDVSAWSFTTSPR